MREALLHAALFTPRGYRGAEEDWGLPILFVGDPGIAKSAYTESYADACGMPCEVLSPSERGEGAFGVTPYPCVIDGETYMTYPKPDYCLRFKETGRGIVFVDECNTIGGVVQSAQLGLVGAKRIGSYKLPPGVRVLGAMNPTDVAANGHDLPAPLVNRYIVCAWDAPSIERYQSYLMGGCRPSNVQGVNPIAEERRVLEAWPEAFAQSTGLFCAFYGAQPQYMQKFPKDDPLASSKPWASCRSNEMALRAHAGASVHGLQGADREDLIRGAVGAQWFEAFSVFEENADLPNAADLLDGKVKWKHTNSRLDRTHAVLASCTSLVVDPKCNSRKERAITLWSMVHDVGTSAGDIIVPVSDELTKAMLHTSPEAVKVLAKIRPAVEAMKAAKARSRGGR